MLKGIEYIKNVGLFNASACTKDASFDGCALIYGENGSGKSTMSDILRSVSLNAPKIVIGRKTLGSNQDQEISLKFDTGNVIFENDIWRNIEICPPIKIFDGLFINDNVYSGDVVSIDHMKRQHKFILGQKGVEYVRTLNKLYEENKLLNDERKTIEAELLDALGNISSYIDIAKFQNLPMRDNIDLELENAKKRLNLAKKNQELKVAPSIKLLDVPSDSTNFEDSFKMTVKEISSAAVLAIKAHISSHEINGAVNNDSLDMETWLRYGVEFKSNVSCPYCGQEILESSLVDAYSQYFSDNYLKLAKDLERNHKAHQIYLNGHFRTHTQNILKENMERFKYWNEAAGVSIPDILDAEHAIFEIEAAAEKVERIFKEKLKNVVAPIDKNLISDAMDTWNKARSGVARINSALTEYSKEVDKIRKGQNDIEQQDIENEINVLKATKIRYTDMAARNVERISVIASKKREIESETKKVRADLTAYSNHIVESLGETINKYLDSLNAEFTVQYEKTNFRGDQPATEYNIIINNVAVSPKQKGDAVDQPSFRNTLSAGDKSVLALSLFLSQCNDDVDLDKTIIVFDDPFTSLDNFRMHVTASRICDVSKKSKQAIILSHHQEFLKILREKLGVNSTRIFEIRNYASEGSFVEPYEMDEKVWPRNVIERIEIEEFVNGKRHNPYHIRSILRKVCESYFWEALANTDIDAKGKALGEIVALLKTAPKNNPYHKFIEDLTDINRYSRVLSHGYEDDDPKQHTNLAELRNFCKKTLRATSGV